MPILVKFRAILTLAQCTEVKFNNCFLVDVGAKKILFHKGIQPIYTDKNIFNSVGLKETTYEKITKFISE